MDIRKQLNELGLGKFCTKILKQQRECIWLSLAQVFAGERLQSRIGGLPELPPSIEWPRDSSGDYMEFVLQINLADLPLGFNSPIGNTGVLQFYLGLDEPAANVEHKILLLGDENLDFRAKPDGAMAGENFEGTQPHLLHLTATPDFPRWSSDDHAKITKNMDDDEQIIYDEDFLFSFQPVASNLIIGRLFGHIASIGHDTREDAEVVKNHNPDYLYNYPLRKQLDLSNHHNWRPLLTIDSNLKLDICIWDSGFINVLLEDEKLKSLDFSNSYVAIETS